MKQKMNRFWNTVGMQYVREIAGVYFQKHVARAAAELAYFLILSFFPLLLCVSAFIGNLNLDATGIVAYLEPILPPSFLTIVAEYLRYVTANSTPGVLAAGVLMILLAASAAMRSLINIMDEIYERKSFKGVRQLGASVMFSLVLLATIYISMIVVLTGNWFLHLIDSHLPPQFRWPGEVWRWGRYVVLFGLMLVLILVVYAITVPREKPRPPILLGAIGADVALVVASMIFSSFIGMSSKYSLVYGSLASVVILLLWLYICGHIVILGNVFNCVRYRRRKAHEAQPAAGEKAEKKFKKSGKSS